MYLLMAQCRPELQDLLADQQHADEGDGTMGPFLWVVEPCEAGLGKGDENGADEWRTATHCWLATSACLSPSRRLWSYV